MKKISSKIIISLVLAAVLWGGGGFVTVKAAEKKGGILDSARSLGESAGNAIVARIKGSPTLATALRVVQDPNGKKDALAGIVGHVPFLGAFAWGNSVLMVENAVLYIANAFFNGSMAFSIQNFRDLVNSSGIENVWSVFRNLINISFIFILLYISISMIIGSVGPKAKSTIASVVIAAILINFSLFLTKLLIDLSNLIAITLYNYNGGTIEIHEWGTGLMNNLGIQSLWQVWLASGQVSLMTDLIFRIILVGILIKTYFKMAFMLIGRIIMLLILMALSPVAFLGSSVPGLKEKSSEWWNAFTGQLLVAPAFMFVILIVSSLERSGAYNKATEIAGTLFKNGQYVGQFNIAPLIYYMIVIGILTTGVKLVEGLSGNVSKIVDKVTGGIKSAAMATVAIGAALATGGATAGLGAGGMARDLITGDIEKQTGLAGVTGRFARSKFMETTKTITGGKVDLKKIETSYKKAQKDELDRIMKKADALGPSKAEGVRTQLEATRTNINDHADARMRIKGSPEETLSKNLTAAVEAQTDAEKRLRETNEKLSRTSDPAAKSALETESANIERELGIAKASTSAARKSFEARKEVLAKKIAEEMGTSFDEIETGIDKANADIIEGISKKNKYMKDLSKTGILNRAGLSTKQLEDAVGKIRAMKGPYKNDEDDLKKLFKKLAKEDEDKTKSAEPK